MVSHWQEADAAPHDCYHHETGTLWSTRDQDLQSVPEGSVEVTYVVD